LNFENYYDEILNKYINRALDMEPQNTKNWEFKKNILRNKANELIVQAKQNILHDRKVMYRIER